MTREEAIYRLRVMQAANDGSFEDSVKEGLKADEPYAPGETMTFREFFKADHEAFDMAIKALERADLDGYSSRLWKAAYERGKAEAEQRWIPVSEMLPEVGSEVLVCYDFKGNRSVYIANFYGDCDFHGLDDEYLNTEGRKYRKAVAWMHLPEPYRAESEDKLDGDPIDTDKAVEHYEGTLEALKDIDLEDNA